MLNLRSLTEMVKQALEDYDPELYFELQDDGSLERVAEQQAEAAFETKAELMNQANRGVSDLEASHDGADTQHYTRNRQADEGAIAQATEFSTIR